MAMTLPFENDNMKITKKLAKNSLKSNKNRNIAAIFAIILTTMCLLLYLRLAQTLLRH